MSRKKKNALLSMVGNPLTDMDEVAETRQPSDSEPRGILERRLEDRKIPKVDVGIPEKYMKNPPPDVADAWYQDCHIGKYVHMEKVTRDGATFTTKRVQFEFGRMLKGYDKNLDDRGVNPAIERLSFATMSKASFINNITNPLRYINYFIEYFDDDDELMRAYFHMMFTIMCDSIELDPQSFIETLYAAFTTDGIIEKLHRMVEYNTDTNLIKKTDRTFDESIQLTVEHLKAIMGVSCLHKFVIPIVSHYYNTRSRLIEKAGITDKDLYYYVFTSFLPVFDDIYGISLYNKIYHTSTTRIVKTANQESEMWIRKNRLGITQASYNTDLMRDFVTDISHKAVFAKSAIVFINVCMDKAIRNILIASDKYEFTEMPTESNDNVNETMSRWDRWQTDKSFHSQRDRIRSYVSIKDAIWRYGEACGLDFRRLDSKHHKMDDALRRLKEEYEFYRDEIEQPLNDTQLYFVQLYFSALMGNTEDPITMEIPDIIKGMMIMKRDFEARNYIYFPFFLTGKVNPSASKTYNKRRIMKLIEAHPLYDDLVQQYAGNEGLLNWDRMVNEIKTIVACPIKIVDFDRPEACGKTMNPPELCAVDEVMRFYNSL